MFWLISVTGLFALAASTSAIAACPTSVPGNSNDAIRNNEQRVLCLQEEVDERSRLRQRELEMRANQDALQSLQLQRRFDNLMLVPAPSPFTQPEPFVPN